MGQNHHFIVADSISGISLPGASIFDKKGNLLGGLISLKESQAYPIMKVGKNEIEIGKNSEINGPLKRILRKNRS